MRTYYFDYLRSFLIFLVIVIHSAIAYTILVPTLISWWVPDLAGSYFFDILLFFLDIFIMPIMFFIAGYFTYPSWKKRTAAIFLKDKCFRLVIPFALGVVFLNGYPNYLKQLIKGEISKGYFHYYFFDYMDHLLTLLKHSTASVHLWFLSFLFLFYLLWVIVHPLIIKINVLKTSSFICLGLITGICFSFINVFVPDYQPWVTYFDFFTIQRTRAPLYFFYFMFGIIFYRNKEQWSCKNLFLWILTALGLCFLDVGYVFLFMKDLVQDTRSIEWICYRSIHAMLHSFSCMGLLVVFLTLFERYFNKPSKIGENMSTNSYAIYIIHFNLLLFVEYFLRAFDCSIYLKFCLVVVFTSISSYILSEYVLKKTPFIKSMLY